MSVACRSLGSSIRCTWVLVLLGLTWPAIVVGADCTSSTLNKSCTIKINREEPVSPVPTRVESRAAVTVEVQRRPLEKISFDTTLADTVPADPFAAIFAAFLPGLQTVSGIARAFDTSPPAGFVDPHPSVVENALDEMVLDQNGLKPALTTVETEIKRAGKMLSDFQSTKAGTWNVGQLTAFRTTFFCEVNGAGASIDSTSCTTPAIGAATARLPEGVVKALSVRLKDVTEQYASLSQGDRNKLAAKLNIVASNQVQLLASLESLGKSQAALIAAATTVKNIDPSKVTVSSSTVVGAFPARTSRTATIKISAQDLISKEKTELATVVVNWGETKLEVSAGALFSALRDRKFSNAVIIENGEPKRDADGKVLTRVTETQTRPVVVPFAFAHYRLGEWAAGGPNRIALLVSGGIGISPYAKSADFAAGGTIAFRGFMFSPTLHWAKDIRLPNGLTVGKELGPSPPELTTERHWVKKLGFGLSYRVPLK
jgi:hypothetical protein